ncbi:MAG TPA: RNA polymerase sigma factor [Clostridiaceae bacterium]|nr:RNA polymerase sigma factor [Clostridiaceae bacterium]
MEEKTDVVLYNSFLKGDNEAFDEIINRYRKNLILFINKYVHDLEISEDLVQDTFVYVLVNRKEYDFKYSLKTYLYTIAKCRASNYIRNQKRIVKFDEAYIKNEEEPEQVEDNLLRKEKNLKVQEALKKLKLEYQSVIFLKDIEEFSYKEICKILDKNMSQVKVLIHRARKSLAKILRKEGFEC